LIEEGKRVIQPIGLDVIRGGFPTDGGNRIQHGPEVQIERLV
jgi:hypothetical protein